MCILGRFCYANVNFRFIFFRMQIGNRILEKENEYSLILVDDVISKTETCLYTKYFSFASLSKWHISINALFLGAKFIIENASVSFLIFRNFHKNINLLLLTPFYEIHKLFSCNFQPSIYCVIYLLHLSVVSVWKINRKNWKITRPNGSSWIFI